MTDDMTEMIRTRWRSALDREALDRVDRPDFAVAGLGSRLRSPSVRLLLLPSDPEAEIVRIDDEFWTWFTSLQVAHVGGRMFRLGMREVPTAHAATFVHGGYEPGQPWDSYVALHRSGAVECGLGEYAAWQGKDRNGDSVRVFDLIQIVARTWALVAIAGAVQERFAAAGPCRLTVAMSDTRNALLGGLGEGWAGPASYSNDVGPCAESKVLWHLDSAEWPEESKAQEIAFSVGDRIEDTWGVRQRRYLANRGQYAGQFDVSKIRA